jgi:uncharacterized protein YrrD
MRKGSDIIGRPVFAYDTGAKLDDRIEDLIFDQQSNQLLGFLLDEKGWFKSARVLPLENVHAIGPDAVIISSSAAIIDAREATSIQDVLDQDLVLKGSRVMTTDGRALGTMVDLFFDESTGAIEGYESSGGLFADAYSGRSFIPAPQTLSIGQDAAFVPPETAELMEEQVGGLKGAVQSANQTIQDAAQATGARVQAAAETAQVNLEAAGLKASETLNQAQRRTDTSITNTIIDPQEQRLFVVGRIAQETVNLPDGSPLVVEGQTVAPRHVEVAANQNLLAQLYRVTGGSVQERAVQQLQEKAGEVTEQVQTAAAQSNQKLQAVGQQAQDAIISQAQALSQATQKAVSSHTLEEARGRRVSQMVRTDTGFIVAAPGQIVTERVIKQARELNQEQNLLAAVGLSPQAAARSRANTALRRTSYRLQPATDEASEQLRRGSEQFQVGVKGLWEEVKDVASTLQNRSAQAIEEKRIKGALGRPATRVILDQQDNIILNTGDLITHHAIERAREAEVLDLILDSVYAGDPQISRDDLRADRAGQESLKAEPLSR